METQEQSFIWDEGKALANERKHGVAFRLATDVLRDPLRVTYHDIGIRILRIAGSLWG